MYSHINHDINFDDIKKTNSNDSNSKNSDEDTFSFDELKYNTESSNESDRESNSSKNSFSVNNKDEGTRSRTNSSISSNPNIETSSPKFKLKNKDKNLLEKNEKNEKNELDDLFSNIDISCDSIINKNKKEVLEEEITEITEIIETTEKMDIIENNISFNMNETQNNIQEDVMNEKLENITLQLLGYTPELIEPPLE
jgi:ATP-dependent Lon protease